MVIGVDLEGMKEVLGIWMRHGAQRTCAVMFDDINFRQRYFKDLSLGGRYDIGSLQTRLAMGTGVGMILVCFVWGGALLKSASFMSFLSSWLSLCFLPEASIFVGWLFESVCGRWLGGIATVDVSQLEQDGHDGFFAFFVEFSCLLFCHFRGWYPTSSRQEKRCLNSY